MYAGYTADLRMRFAEHNSKKTFSTSYRGPFELIYYEAYKTKEDAMAREIFFKTGWGRAYIKRALKYYFQDKNLGG